MIGFWIFMLIMVLLIPGTMLGFGILFTKKAPNNINFVFGYRTARSMKNKNTWNFAHKYIGRLWKILALIMLPLSVIAMLFVLGSDVDTVGTVGGIIVMIQLIPMVAAIFPTERALKKNFDEFGRKR